MKVTYRGVHNELPPRFQEKLDAKFAKLSKILERRGEKEAHVVVTSERHLHNAEITLQFYDHQLIGIDSDADLFTAVSKALDKLDKQAVKQREKWRGKTRRSNGAASEAAEMETEAAAEPDTAQAGRNAPRVYKVDHQGQRKPMTLE